MHTITSPRIVVASLLVLTNVILGQVQSQPKATPKANSARPPKAYVESPEHQYARAALDNATSKLMTLSPVRDELGGLHGCLVMEDPGPVMCKLNKAQIQAGVDKYCGLIMQRPEPKPLEGDVARDPLFVEMHEADIKHARAEKRLDCADEIGRRLKRIFADSDEINAQTDLLQERLEHADACAAIYRATIDRKASNLTVRQSSQVAACNALDEYPPKRVTHQPE